MSIQTQMQEDMKRAIGEEPIACKFGAVDFNSTKSSLKSATNNGEFGVSDKYELTIRAMLSDFPDGAPKIDDEIEIIGDKVYRVSSFRKDAISILLNLEKAYT